MKIFYFGCWNEPGHYFHSPNGRTHWKSGPTPEFGPWIPETIDGCLQPGCEWDWQRDRFVCKGPETQGVGRLHHKDGWTALAFWDRTQDKRPACNSTFIAEGTFTEEEMKALAAEHFPRIWTRMQKGFPQNG